MINMSSLMSFTHSYNFHPHGRVKKKPQTSKTPKTFSCDSKQKWKKVSHCLQVSWTFAVLVCSCCVFGCVGLALLAGCGITCGAVHRVVSSYLSPVALTVHRPHALWRLCATWWLKLSPMEVSCLFFTVRVRCVHTQKKVLPVIMCCGRCEFVESK